ncbi:hypothetical protein EMO89_01535 [Bifidobacterium tissieri]|uniref:Uncharacterized protein n=1 Tax=Bifidobacterium tissieri TaxID=1630162 RepID=A0A5M9ZUY8_9BIFI|nr:hypothetical protein [Bifidobacterium tissieri]KAA8831446.1 hypothetical protein EMO89_01535 [Bifidobacterium tissieri]
MKPYSVEVFCDVFQNLKKGEQPQPDFIRISVNPDHWWPDSCWTAILHLADKTQQNCLFADYDTFQRFKRQVETKIHLSGVVSDWAEWLDPKGGDIRKLFAYLLANPKPVAGRPPESVCPRCETPIWQQAGMRRMEIDAAYQARPLPVYCLTCGQRFKHETGRIAYQATSSAREAHRIAKALELASSQPTLQESELAAV